MHIFSLNFRQDEVQLVQKSIFMRQMPFPRFYQDIKNKGYDECLLQYLRKNIFDKNTLTKIMNQIERVGCAY